MNKEHEERFIIFIIDFENTLKDVSNYLSTKESVSSIILKTFINGLQELINNLKNDIDFLNKELIFDTGTDDKAYINNFIYCAESDIKSMHDYIDNKQDVTNKDYSTFFNDFLCKVRNLKQNVKFLQGEHRYIIKSKDNEGE